MTDVRAEPIGEATGFLGELRRLHLRYELGGRQGPARLIAKAPTTDAGGLEVGRLLNVWARESRFFADLAPSAATRVPRCYANLGDARTDRWLLLLEDVGDSTAAGQTQGASRHQALAALAEIAGLHRQYDGVRPTEWLPGFDRGPLTALQHAVQYAVEPFLQRYGEQLPVGGADLLRRFAPRLSAWAQRQARTSLSVVHADYRLDNVVFRASGEVVVLDWQTALLGAGEMDLASFVVTSLTVEDRREWEGVLFEHYADARGRTVEHVRSAFREHLLWWMALYANNLSRIDPADPQGVAMFDNTVHRTFVAAADHEVAALIPV